MINHATVMEISMTPFLFPIQAKTRQRGRSGGRPFDIVDLTAMLGQRYPLVQRLAGEESFRGAAIGFVFSEPPPCQKHRGYGDTFPNYLRKLGSSASIEYLADIAELEMAHTKAHNAAGPAPLANRRRTSGSTKPAALAPVVLHPSVSVVESRFPIVTIWEAHERATDGAIITRWNAEAALVAAPDGVVSIHRLPAGGAAFFRALQSGVTIADAIAKGQAATLEFDAAANLAFLNNAHLAVEDSSRDAA